MGPPDDIHSVLRVAGNAGVDQGLPRPLRLPVDMRIAHTILNQDLVNLINYQLVNDPSSRRSNGGHPVGEMRLFLATFSSLCPVLKRDEETSVLDNAMSHNEVDLGAR